MNRHALIAGGGIAGLTAALCLHRHGWTVSVFEQASGVEEVGAGIQLSPNATRVLRYLGLEAALQAVSVMPIATEVRHWRSGRVISTAPAGAALERKFGAPYYHIHRGDLLRVLADAVANCDGIAVHLAAPVEVIESNNTDRIVVAVGGNSVSGDLLVGADGIHSTVRPALFADQSAERLGEKLNERSGGKPDEKPARDSGEESSAPSGAYLNRSAATFTGNVAWRGLVPRERLSGPTLRQVGTVWWGPGKHFVHYWVKSGDYMNCVGVVEQRGWEVESWTERGDHNELRANFAGWHPELRTLIDQLDPDACFRWALFDRPPLTQWSIGRATLIGDACHPMLPFMAQGAAMSIEDAAVLGNCLSATDDIPAALATYAALRRPRTAAAQRGSRRNARIFHLREPFATARNIGLRLAQPAVLNGLYSYDALTTGTKGSPGQP